MVISIHLFIVNSLQTPMWDCITKYSKFREFHCMFPSIRLGFKVKNVAHLWSPCGCRLPFQQDVEYGNTTSHLGDCDGKLQHYDLDAPCFCAVEWGKAPPSGSSLHYTCLHVFEKSPPALRFIPKTKARSGARGTEILASTWFHIIQNSSSQCDVF